MIDTRFYLEGNISEASGDKDVQMVMYVPPPGSAWGL